MAIQPGIHKLGPPDGNLTVRTGRTGAAAKAGHDLLMEVTAWEATLEVGEDPSVALVADATSLRVREGTGGMQGLGGDDVANIHQTIDDDVLKRKTVVFRSTEVQTDGSRLTVRGELTVVGTARPLELSLSAGDDGRLTGSAVVNQTDWGLKPYSALFGTLKVADEVEVAIDVRLHPLDRLQRS